MRVYYYAEARWALDNIANQRLKVCRFFDLNDPFELLAGEQGDKTLRKKMRGWAEQVNRQDGLLCFTKSWRNALVWSHYGDRHKGMCLGFDVDDSILERIDYQPLRLPLDEWKCMNNADPPKELRQALLTTKFARWRYEEERRVILSLVDLKKEEERFFKRFDDKLKLVEVVAGPRCCVRWKPHIKSAIEKLPVKPNLIKARLSFKKFKVVTQKVENSAPRGFESDTYWQECACASPEYHDVAG